MRDSLTGLPSPLIVSMHEMLDEITENFVFIYLAYFFSANESDMLGRSSK